MRFAFYFLWALFSAPVFAQSNLKDEPSVRDWTVSTVSQCDGSHEEWKETCEDFAAGISFHQANHLEHSRYSYYKACVSNPNTLPQACYNLGLLEREEQKLKDADYYLEKACLVGMKISCYEFFLNQAYQGNFKEILARTEEFCSKHPEKELCTYLPLMREPSKFPKAKSIIQAAFVEKFERKNANRQIPPD
jgi:TPR repeat protein